jgi:predicted DsbA family dithiol-disulfide isomerase
MNNPSRNPQRSVAACASRNDDGVTMPEWSVYNRIAGRVGWLLVLIACFVPPQGLHAQESGSLTETPLPVDGQVEMTRAEDGAFVIGDEDAPVTLVLFTDFACQQCQSYRPAVSQFVETFVDTGLARLELRIFPTVGGEQTVLAGRAAECADVQSPGAFWQARELLYTYATSSRYDATLPEQLAQDLALDVNTLLRCLDTAQQVERDIALGQELGVSGTPLVYIRYRDGSARFIRFDGRTYRAGGPHFGILSAAVLRGQYR